MLFVALTMFFSVTGIAMLIGYVAWKTSPEARRETDREQRPPEPSNPEYERYRRLDE